MYGLQQHELPSLDPQKCTIQLGLPGPYGYSRAIVQAVDKIGFKMTTGGAKVEAIEDGYSHTVQDNNDGTYTFEYMSYGSLHVKLNGVEIRLK